MVLPDTVQWAIQVYDLSISSLHNKLALDRLRCVRCEILHPPE
jgi:hypothetical protein